MLVLPRRLEPLRAAYKRIMAADPFLMSAAIAYNAFFALVPLTFAAVAGLSVFGANPNSAARINGMVANGFPEQVGEFLLGIFDEAEQVAAGQGTAVLVISLLVALWSGSRAIYAVQKALRLIEGGHEDRSYWKTRGLGYLFTFGAGIALIIGYIVVIFGSRLTQALELFGIHIRSVTWITGLAAAGWIVVVLYAIYEWGTPTQIRRPLAGAVAATGVLIATTSIATMILPDLRGSTIAMLGSVGVVLVWSYAIGLIVIVVPTLVPAIEDTIRGVSP